MIWPHFSHFSHRPSVRRRFSLSARPSSIPVFSRVNHAIDTASSVAGRGFETLLDLPHVGREIPSIHEAHPLVKLAGGGICSGHRKADAAASVIGERHQAAAKQFVAEPGTSKGR